MAVTQTYYACFCRADELAVAMESRCYHGDQGRTRMKQLMFRRGDYITFAAAGVLLCGVIVLAVLGL